MVTIIPEALELGDFYESDINFDDVAKAVKQQNQRHKRFGLDQISSVQQEREIINEYWNIVKDNKRAVKKEGVFVKSILSADLQPPIERGIERARYVLPKKEFKDPSVLMVCGIRGQAAKVLENNSFGINMSQMAAKCDFDAEKFLPFLESLTSHESNHIYVDQLGVCNHSTLSHIASKISDGHSLRKCIATKVFKEGLGTYAELQQVLDSRTMHERYMKDIVYWEDAIDRSIECSPDERGVMLAEIAKKLASPELFQKELKNIRQKRYKKISFSDYSQILSSMLIKNDGPAYHVGYNMWKKIGDAYGIEKVREVVSKGSSELFKVYGKLGV